MKKTILVTGAAGFIGFHLSKKLSESGFNVIGIDNLNDYYEVFLKKMRLEKLGVHLTEKENEKSADSCKTELNEVNKLRRKVKGSCFGCEQVKQRTF